MIALDGCYIARSHDGNVEVVEASPAHRAFPSRVTESLGICLKTGPEHRVMVDGRELVFPENAICVRRPGCVWSTAGTGPVGFLSLDIDPCLLPAGLSSPAMTFARNTALPGFNEDARAALSVPSDRVAAVVGSLVFALEAAGALAADELRVGAPSRTAERGREALEARISEAPSLMQLASELGTNRFVLMREFKRSYGITPHAFLMRLRIERARERLARGADVVEVAIELGFADQAHLTRLFKRVVGTTPGRYARSARVHGAVPLRTFVQEQPPPHEVLDRSCKHSPSTATAAPFQPGSTSSAVRQMRPESLGSSSLAPG